METANSNMVSTTDLFKSQLLPRRKTTAHHTKKVNKSTATPNGVVAQIKMYRQVNSGIRATSPQIARESLISKMSSNGASRFSQLRARLASIFSVTSDTPTRATAELVARHHRTTTEWNRSMGMNAGTLSQAGRQYSDAANERINHFKLCGM